MVARGNIWQQALVGQDASEFEFGKHHRTVNSAHTPHTLHTLHTHTPHSENELSYSVFLWRRV